MSSSSSSAASARADTIDISHIRYLPKGWDDLVEKVRAAIKRSHCRDAVLDALTTIRDAEAITRRMCEPPADEEFKRDWWNAPEAEQHAPSVLFLQDKLNAVKVCLFTLGATMTETECDEKKCEPAREALIRAFEQLVNGADYMVEYEDENSLHPLYDALVQASRRKAQEEAKKRTPEMNDE